MTKQQTAALALLKVENAAVTAGAAQLSDGNIYLLRLVGNKWQRAERPYGDAAKQKLAAQIEANDSNLVFEMPAITGVTWICGFKSQKGGFQDL